MLEFLMQLYFFAISCMSYRCHKYNLQVRYLNLYSIYGKHYC
uniref:Uncharacterized protein n=1 Tax=Arundo donax TaxID=35708 RepID=A0A0A8YTB6_ARUDO